MLTSSMFVDICLIFASLLTTLYFWMKWKHSYWERRGIRSLPGHWLFGNMKDGLFMRTGSGQIFGKLYEQAKDDEDYVGIYIFQKPFLLIRKPELIKQIMIKDFHLFPNHHFTAARKGDKINMSTLFTIDNPEWKYLRTKMSPVFTSGKLKSLFFLVQECAEEMRDHIRAQFKNNSESTKSIFIKETFYKYTTNVISSVAFGIRTNCFDIPTPEFYHWSRSFARVTFVRAFRFFFMFFFPSIGKYVGDTILSHSTGYFRKVFWDSMDTRAATKMKRGDLIDSLLKLKDETPDSDTFRFEGDALFAQAAIFFVAGRETSITTMTYTLCELAKQPDIQNRARTEILETIETNGLNYDSVMDMKYLHQIISETLRIYPPASIIDRVPVVDYTLPKTNIIIEKGTPIYVSLYGLHSDPKYHPNPDRFDPDRFSDERKGEIISCTYMPFGEGPRNCIGMRLGQMQTAMGLISILRDYEVSLHSDWMCMRDPKSVFTTPPEHFQLLFKKL